MQFTQEPLFPESTVQTSGWARPDTDDAEQAVEETQAEAA